MKDNKAVIIILASLVIFIVMVSYVAAIFEEPTQTTENVRPIAEEEQRVEEELAENEEDETDEEEEGFSQDFRETVKDVVEGALNIFKKETHIVAVGDSLTQGVGDETGNAGYIGILEDRLVDNDFKVSFENYGVRGNQTKHLIKRLEENEDLRSSLENADVVLITIGANDIMRIMRDNFTNLTEEPFMADRDDYEVRMSTILEIITELQPEADIYLLGFFNPFEKYFGDIPALNEIMIRWNDSSKRVAESFEQVTFIPMKDIYKNREGNFFAEDYIHPNREGYVIMANRVQSYMQAALEEDENEEEAEQDQDEE